MINTLLTWCTSGNLMDFNCLDWSKAVLMAMATLQHLSIEGQLLLKHFTDQQQMFSSKPKANKKCSKCVHVHSRSYLSYKWPEEVDLKNIMSLWG